MRKTKKVFMSVLLSAAMCLGLCACGGEGGGIVYPDFPLTENNGTPSWEQGEKSDLEIDWYVDDSTFSWAGASGSDVVDEIYEKTGIKINFQVPLNDDGTMLNSILNSPDMPDLISISCKNTTRVQMQEEGYVYPLDGLAERWAPTLFNNWSPEINQLYAATDGQLYGVPCLYYSMDDIEAFDDQGSVLQANYAAIARKDYLDAYVAYKKAQDPNWSDKEATTPSGFIEMCKWVKNTYNVDHPILTDAFLTTENNAGVYALAQFFSVPRESEDGDLLYLEEQEEFYKTLEFLNTCYNEGLISDSNFSNTKQQQANIISAGGCFIFIGPVQSSLYGSATRNFALKYTEGLETTNQYVGIVLTDEEGNAPVMDNLSGNGNMFTMVTKDCDRPDRVVKFIDYLTSMEGQMLTYFGVQGEHWNYEIQPGETIVEDGITKTFKYGRVQWTEEAFKLITSGQGSSVIGALTFQLLRPNKAIAKLATFSGDEMYQFATYLTHNIKAVTSEWAYTGKLLNLDSVRDARGGDNYLEVTTTATLCQQLWRERLAEIITASNADACREAYEATLTRVREYGIEEVKEFDNALFHRLKEQFGMEYVWAPLTDGYDPAPVTSIYGNTSYIVEIPDFIERK